MTGHTTAELAALLGVTPRRVLALCANRGIVGRRVGGAWLWPGSAFEALRVRRTGGKPRGSKDKRPRWRA